MPDQEQKLSPNSPDESSWETSKVTRRRFLLSSVAAGLSLVLIACKSEPTNKLDLTEIQKYQLKKYPKFSVSDFEVNLLADPLVKVNPDRYKMILGYITNLGKNGATIPYSYSGRRINGRIRYSKENTRNFYLLTDNIPFPAHGSTVSNEAFTQHDNSNQTTNSFIRVHNNIPSSSDNPITINLANVTMFVESCQSIIQAGADNQADSDTFQEIFCNSVGQAIAMKESDYSYPDYQKLYSQATLHSPDRKTTMPMLVLPESEWNLIPKTGPVIS